MKQTSPRRADRSPERCRADGGLLGAEDPAGRFALVVVTAVLNGFAACLARTPNPRANGQPDFLSGFPSDLGLISTSASRRRSSNSTRSGGAMSGHSTPGSCIGLGSPTSLSPLVRNAIRPTVAGPAACRSKSRFSGRSGVLGRDSFSSRARFAGSSGWLAATQNWMRDSQLGMTPRLVHSREPGESGPQHPHPQPSPGNATPPAGIY